MKKSIILTIAMVLVLSVLLTACGTAMFPLDEERAIKQVTADVSYAGRAGIVDVNEIYQIFNYNYNLINQYYQYGYIQSEEQYRMYMAQTFGDLDKYFEQTNLSLAKNSALTLKAIDKLYNYYVTDRHCADADKVAAAVAASTAGKSYNFSKLEEVVRFQEDRVAELVAILSCYTDYSYVNAAYKAVNDDLQKSFDYYLEEIVSEQTTTTTEGDETKSGFTSIKVTAPQRLVYEVSTASDKDKTKVDTLGMVVEAIYEDGTTAVIPNRFVSVATIDCSKAAEEVSVVVTYGEASANFKVSVVEARPNRATLGKKNEEETASSTDHSELLELFSFEIDQADFIKDGMSDDELAAARQDLKNHRDAMARLIRAQEDNYRMKDGKPSLTAMLYSQLNQQARAAVNDIISAEIVISDTDIQEAYDKLLSEQIEAYINKPFDTTALEKHGDTIALANYDAGMGYYYVAQVYLPFGKAQLDAIKLFKDAGTASEQAIKEFIIAQGGEEYEIWLSNPEYEADAKCEDEDCKCPHCANYDIEANGRYSFTTLDEYYSCPLAETEACPCASCPSNKFTGKMTAADIVAAIAEGLADINADTYANEVERYNAQSDFMKEWTYKANQDTGMFTNFDSGKYGYAMKPNGEDMTGELADIKKATDFLAKYNGVVIASDAEASAEKADLEKDGIYILSDKGGKGSYAYVITSTGIRFVTITAYDKDSDLGTFTITEDGEYAALGLDYIADINLYKVIDSGNKYKVSTASGDKYLVGGTIAAFVYDEVYAESVTSQQGKFETDFFANDFDENKDINTNPKGYEYVLKKLKGE